MSTVPVATADLAGAHEAVKGAHAPETHTKSTAFEKLLEEAASHQAAGPQAASHQAASHQAAGPQAASHQAVSRGPDATEGVAPGTLPMPGTKAEPSGKSTRTTPTRTTPPREKGQATQRVHAFFATLPGQGPGVASQIAPAARQGSARGPVDARRTTGRRAEPGTPSTELIRLGPSNGASGTPVGHIETPVGAGSARQAQTIAGAGPAVRAEAAAQAARDVRTVPVKGDVRRTSRAPSGSQGSVQPEDIQPNDSQPNGLQANGVQPAVPVPPEGSARAASQPAAGAQRASNLLPGVAGQLVDVLSAPRQGADGSFVVTVALHPAALGAVRATVIANESQVSVQLVPSTAEGAAALRLALPDLRSALSSNGQQVQVTVREIPASSSKNPAASSKNPFSAGQGGGGHPLATSRHDHPAPGRASRPARDPAPQPVSTVPLAAAPAPSPHLVDIRI
ncbi:MAG: flagellar hook-length control protein FliK [Acidimicrobiales bacterium]